MSESAAKSPAPAAGAAPPKRIIAEAQPPKPTRRADVDSIVDSVLAEGLDDLPEGLLDDQPGKKELDLNLDGIEVGDDDGTDDQEIDTEAGGDEDARPERRKPSDGGVGSEGNPYTVKTLPADKFVKLKVDGEDTVVPMKELADGYIRQQTFNKRLNHADQLAEQATAIANKAVQERESLRSSFREVMGDPETLFGYMLDNHQPTLERVATEYAKLHASWLKDPHARRAFDLERKETKLREREEGETQRRQTEQETQRQDQEVARVRAALEPAYQDGLKAAGFPKVTPEFQETLKALCEQRRRATGKPITPDDLKAAVIRTAKIVAAETVNERKPEPTAKNNTVTRPKPKASEKLDKSDPDYWLRGVKVSRRQ